MRRQLYSGGGITDLYPRQKYGIGSWVKERVRKLIPNELADVATKAAPFVAPFNPGIAALMRGVGRFDQRGSISDALKQGALTYGGGQLARQLGGAGVQTDFLGTPGDRFTTPLRQDRMEGLRNLFRAREKTQIADKPVGKIDSTAAKQLMTTDAAYSGNQGLVKNIWDKWQDMTPGMKTAIVGVGSGTLAGVAQWFENQIPQEPGESMAEWDARREVAVKKLMRQYMDNTRAYDPAWSSMTDQQKDETVGQYYNQGGRVGYQTGGTMMDITGGSPYLDDEGYFKYIDPDTSIDLQKEFDRRFQISNKLQSLYNLGFSTIPEFVNQYGSVFGKGDYSSKLDPNKVDQAEALLKKYSTADILPLLDPNTRYGRSYRTPEEEAKRLQEAREEYNFNVNPIIQYPQTTAAPEVASQITNTAQVASPRTIPTDTGALKVAEPEGIQTIPGEKKVFNVMMDPKGNVMKDQGIAQLARDTGVAPYIQNYPINSMSDVMRMIGPGTGIPQGTEYDSIGMGRSLKENIAANEAQRLRNFDVRQAARSRLPGYGSGPVSSIVGPEGPLMFTNPGVVTQANPGGYRSEQEAIADLGIEKYNTMYNQGGRVGLRFGTPEAGIKSLDAGAIGNITYEGNEGPQSPLKEKMMMADVSNMRQKLFDMGYDWINDADDVTVRQIYDSEMGTWTDSSVWRTTEAKGGRIGQMIGTGPAGLPGIPRQAPDGMEFDMRQNGGFQPLGAKEKKDDVPAMLAKNEFVFTADAVRGAGGGDIELGAQRMYDTMKNLEKRVV